MKKGTSSIQTIDPASKEIIETYVPLGDKELLSRLETGQQFFEKWRREPFSKTASLLESLSDHLIKKKHSFAKLISREMGKPLNQSEAEIEKCAFLCRYYLKNGERFLSPREERVHYKKSFGV